MRWLTMLLLVSALPAQAPGIPWWRGKFEEGLKEATARNVPILCAFIQDGEEANDRIVAQLYADPAFIKLLDGVIPIICCRTVHPPKKQTIKGRDEAVCSKFGAVGCQTHQEQEIHGRGMFWPEKLVSTPHHVVALPDGTEIARLQDVVGLESFATAIRQAQKKLGAGLGTADYERALDSLQAATAAWAKRERKAAILQFSEFGKLAGKLPLLARGESLRKLIEAESAGRTAEIQAHREAGRLTDALRVARAAASEFESWPTKAEFAAVLAEAKKSKEGRAALSELEREDKAIPVFDAAKKLEDQRLFERAIREYARVITLAPSSAVATEAESRLIAMKNDADIAKLAKGALDEWQAEAAIRRAETAKAKGDLATFETELKQVLSQWPAARAAKRAAKLLGSGR